MATTNPFVSEGTRVYHGTAGGTVAVCRLVASNGSGAYVACPDATRPAGVASDDFSSGDALDYHRLGKCTLETDGSAAVGEYVKADAGGLGKGIKDSSPGIVTAGKVLSIDAATNMAFVELWI